MLSCASSEAVFHLQAHVHRGFYLLQTVAGWLFIHTMYSSNVHKSYQVRTY